MMTRLPGKRVPASDAWGSRSNHVIKKMTTYNYYYTAYICVYTYILQTICRLKVIVRMIKYIELMTYRTCSAGEGRN